MSPSSSTPLKIFLVLDGLWAGGTERSLAELLPYLREADIEPTIVCFRRRRENSIEAEVIEGGYEVLFLENGEARTLASQVRALRREIRRRKPAIVHASLYQASLVSRLAGIGLDPVILNSLVNTPYEPLRIQAEPRLQSKKARLKHRVVQGIDALTARAFADHLHAVSGAARDAAVRALGYPRERITVVERGRDPQRLGEPSVERRREAREALGIPQDAKLIVNVGRQDPQKGHLDLLRAFAQTAEQHPDALLRVAGRPGASSGAIEQLKTQLGLGEKAVFVGHVEVTPWLAAADLFAFPSYFEGLPGAVIEATAFALPIVGYRIPPVVEVVREEINGRLVDPGDPAALADTLSALLADPAQAIALGKKGRELFLSDWTLKRSAERMVGLYRSLAV